MDTNLHVQINIGMFLGGEGRGEGCGGEGRGEGCGGEGRRMWRGGVKDEDGSTNMVK